MIFERDDITEWLKDNCIAEEWPNIVVDGTRSSYNEECAAKALLKHFYPHLYVIEYEKE